jgi:parvulin-like peptidyl-prolyl isomerase
MSSKAEKQAARAALRRRRAQEKAARRLAAATAVRARHILVKHAGSRTPLSRRTLMPVTITRAEAHAELERILAVLDEVPEDFASIEAKFSELAAERSDCDTHSKGGDVGVFGEGQMQKAFFEEVSELDVGDISTVFDTGSGSHIALRIPLTDAR